MNDQLVTNITTIVDEIFKKKEEAEMKKETEAALTSAAENITQLNESFEAKDVEHEAEVAGLQETITSLETQLNDAVESKTALEGEKATFDEEKDKLTKRAETAEEELDNMKKDQMAKDRMEALRTAGVSSTNEEIQQEKVRNMSEEDFAAYQEELVSIKESIVKQLESSGDGGQKLKVSAEEKALAAKEALVVAEEAEQAKVLEARLAGLKEAGAEVTDEAEIEKIKAMDDEVFASFKDEVVASLDDGSEKPIDPMRAVAAALNMEVKPNEDILKKYRALGAQMADNIKAKKDK